MSHNIRDLISEYEEKLYSLDLSVGDDVLILYDAGGNVFTNVSDEPIYQFANDQRIATGDHNGSDAVCYASMLRSNKTQKAMIVCKPPYTGICIESRHEIPAVLDDMAQIAGPKIHIVGNNAKEINRALRHANAVMTQERLIVAGRTLSEAVTCLIVVEKSAEITLKSQVIGGVKPLSGRLSRHMHRIYLNKYSKPEKEFQSKLEANDNPELATFDTEDDPKFSLDGDGVTVSRENERSNTAQFDTKESRARGALVKYGKRLVEKGLVQGTWGNISIRLNDTYMICTPSGISYDRLTPEDMVKVNIKDLKADGKNKPTSEKSLHAGIYRAHPEARAVIHTHSKYCSIFAAGEMPLQIEDMGKIARVGEIINISKYALAGTNRITRNVLAVMIDAPGCIISHHGMVCMGADIEEAFKNAEAIEDAAREYIDKRWEK